MPREEDCTSHEFGEDTPDRPHVDRFKVVLFRSEEHLGGSVTARNHVFGMLGLACMQLANAKINKLQNWSSY